MNTIDKIDIDNILVFDTDCNLINGDASNYNSCVECYRYDTCKEYYSTHTMAEDKKQL